MTLLDIRRDQMFPVPDAAQIEAAQIIESPTRLIFPSDILTNNLLGANQN